MKSVTKVVVVAAGATLLSLMIHTREASAVIADQSQNFTDGTFADNAALVTAGYTFSDLGAVGGLTGPHGLDTTQPLGDPDGTDGVNDGAIYVDATVVNETVTYAFPGTITNGAEYMFGANLFQSSTSGIDADVELLANGVVVASVLDFGRLFASQGGAGPATLFYKGTPATNGQTLSFRVRAVRGNDASFDVGIDNWALTNRALVTPIADQFETFTGSVPFGYTWSLNQPQGGPGVYDNTTVAPGGNNPALPSGGIFPGDAALDGGIFVNGNNNTAPTSTVAYKFEGVIAAGQQYDFDAFLYQSSTSFGESNVELIADPGGPNEEVVASLELREATMNAVNGKAAGPAFVNLASLSYTGAAADAGQQLGFRVSSIRPLGGGSSDVAIDGWALSLSAGGQDGDFDFDTDVDGNDFLVWQRGQSPNPNDPGDLALWRANFGAGAAVAAVSSVPEPASRMLVLLSGTMAMTWRRLCASV